MGLENKASWRLVYRGLITRKTKISETSLCSRWYDKNIQLVPHREHRMLPIERPTCKLCMGK